MDILHLRATGQIVRLPAERLKLAMQNMRRLTCVLQREGDGFVSFCPELDIASQGDTIEQARANLIEAVELFFETADKNEITQRLRGEMYVTPIEVRVA